jgi:hypothetical protein
MSYCCSPTCCLIVVHSLFSCKSIIVSLFFVFPLALGLMAGTVDGVATQAAVVDLLVTICKAAAQSTRSNAVLNPFPQVLDPESPDVCVVCLFGVVAVWLFFCCFVVCLF